MEDTEAKSSLKSKFSDQSSVMHRNTIGEKCDLGKIRIIGKDSDGNICSGSYPLQSHLDLYKFLEHAHQFFLHDYTTEEYEKRGLNILSEIKYELEYFHFSNEPKQDSYPDSPFLIFDLLDTEIGMIVEGTLQNFMRNKDFYLAMMTKLNFCK
jgi:hypothetical protein